MKYRLYWSQLNNQWMCLPNNIPVYREAMGNRYSHLIVPSKHPVIWIKP